MGKQKALKGEPERKRTSQSSGAVSEQGGGPGLSFPIPNLPPSLISHTVSVDVKHREIRWTTELRSCI